MFLETCISDLMASRKVPVSQFVVMTRKQKFEKIYIRCQRCIHSLSPRLQTYRIRVTGSSRKGCQRAGCEAGLTHRCGTGQGFSLRTERGSQAYRQHAKHVERFIKKYGSTRQLFSCAGHLAAHFRESYDNMHGINSFNFGHKQQGLTVSKATDATACVDGRRYMPDKLVTGARLPSSQLAWQALPQSWALCERWQPSQSAI
jgi:hypothetical protein